MEDDFKKFMVQRESAAEAYVSGDFVPLEKIEAHEDPATFFGPQGGSVQDAGKVSADYKKGAAIFKSGSKSNFEILHMDSGGNIGYWVGFQKATARMEGSPKPVPFDLRITEIFRREGGEWKLIHRHADPLAKKSEKKR